MLHTFFAIAVMCVQGILDKLVCQQSPMFLYPPEECGGVESSYTRSILEARTANGTSAAWVVNAEHSGP